MIAGLLAPWLSSTAKEISVEMNTVSTTMSLRRLTDNEVIDAGSPVSRKYTFDAEPGEYLLTGFATDGKTVNGVIKLSVTESEESQEFKVLTCTVYASNKKEDKSTWKPEEDYTLSVELMNKEGELIETVAGESSTVGRMTFLALSGNSYFATMTPSEEWRTQGYMELFKSGTLTANINVTGAIPQGGDYSISLPEDAELELGIKFTHFTKFRTVKPESVSLSEEGKICHYHLANSQVYNYRTWKEDGVTYAGYFTMNIDESKCPVIAFTEEDYAAYSPSAVNHSVESNDGYETGDIFVNINPQGYLRLEKGETFSAHAMRSWQLTDSAVGNYFMEPDFHYSVINLDGSPSEGVIEISNPDTTTDPWSTITAIGEGTVIVMVTYDAIALDYYSGLTKKPYMGGEFWGAIWPENTAAFVVSVGLPESKAVPNMVINEEYNSGTSKIAGKYLDSECDVLYYFSKSNGAEYRFSPENTQEVTVARPSFSSGKAEYSGFTSEGVAKEANGEYTILLSEGRNIVALKDEDGNPTYQIITARKCDVEINNESDPEREYYIPGDKVKIQFTGLRHPANKLAGIYNMSAYVTFNGVPNGTSLILGSNQYKFGSTPAAQAVTFTIPENYDTENNPEWTLSEGSIQINGYGDPIGSHRNISPVIGRSPNFTAIAHKTYLGIIPDISIPVTKDIISGMKSLDNAREIKSIWSIEGNPLRTLQPGINIVIYTDGTTGKIFIK